MWSRRRFMTAAAVIGADGVALALGPSDKGANHAPHFRDLSVALDEAGLRRRREVRAVTTATSIADEEDRDRSTHDVLESVLRLRRVPESGSRITRRLEHPSDLRILDQPGDARRLEERRRSGRRLGVLAADAERARVPAARGYRRARRERDRRALARVHAGSKRRRA